MSNSRPPAVRGRPAANLEIQPADPPPPSSTSTSVSAASSPHSLGSDGSLRLARVRLQRHRDDRSQPQPQTPSSRSLNPPSTNTSAASTPSTLGSSSSFNPSSPHSPATPRTPASGSGSAGRGGQVPLRGSPLQPHQTHPSQRQVAPPLRLPSHSTDPFRSLGDSARSLRIDGETPRGTHARHTTTAPVQVQISAEDFQTLRTTVQNAAPAQDARGIQLCCQGCREWLALCRGGELPVTMPRVSAAQGHCCCATFYACFGGSVAGLLLWALASAIGL